MFVMNNYLGTLTLSGNTTVNNNTATRGGGIYNVSGTLNNCNAGGNVFGNTPNDIVG